MAKFKSKNRELGQEDFVQMEPVIIYTTNGGNGISIEPVRDRTEWIGRLETFNAGGDIEKIAEFLRKHFAAVGENRAT